ncbi:MAG: hypothetical protein ACR2OB_08060 [Solirubrobacteraceae bacterium]
MRVVGHGRSVDAPAGWEARIFARAGAAPILHVATFPLAEHDGDFGAAATARMRSGDAFAALIEYRVDETVRPGHGLFSPSGRPSSLRAIEFRPNQLQVARRGQLGCQRFFTDAGRPCCLYSVIQPGRKPPERLAQELSGVLATFELARGGQPGASSTGRAR